MPDERVRVPGKLTVGRILGGANDDDKKFSLQFEDSRYHRLAEFWCNGQTLAEALTGLGARPGEVWVKPNEGSDGQRAEKYRAALLAIRDCLQPYGKRTQPSTRTEESLLILIEDALAD
jgi:hypothetical protein